jgi:PAS domain S-box-containing protein
MTADSDVPILVVDDRHENLVAVDSVLADRGYEIVTATSGAAALKQVLDRTFGAILVDVVMPDMDGFELVTIVKQRERSRHTPIIFLTAGAPDLEHIYRGYSVGAVDYMTKPLDPDVLRAKVAIFADLFRKDRRIEKQQEALRVASEQRYRNLAEAIPQIVWTAKPDGAMTYFNRRWSEQTDQDLDAATGWGWLAVLHPDDAERCIKIWRDGVAAGSVFQLECRLREQGGYRWHLGRAVPELGPTGGIVAWLGTFTDFDELHRAYDAAERAIHTRDEFLSIASHELRTPLTTLQLRLHSLKRDVLGEVPTSETERKLDATLRQGHRLMNLVDSLLDVSRITTGKITLHRETFDLMAVIRELVQRFAEVAAMAGVSLDLHADGVLEGSWDRLRVEQIAENLVTNALKYAPRAPVDITVNAVPTGARLVVRDRGPGIDEIDRERIFGAFERAVSARNFGGLGLGLFIARQNAEAHGGTVIVDSKRGVGTTFTVELPFESQIAP